jgi:hypothetical protein
MTLLVVMIALGTIWWLNRSNAQSAVAHRAARDLLGVSPFASEAEIRAAHRQLIARVHPDVGGSAAMAGQVNAARDLLVTELNRKGA